jgi:hypothetical protein
MAVNYVPDEPPPLIHPNHPLWDALGPAVHRTVGRLAAAGIPIVDVGHLFELLVPDEWPPARVGPDGAGYIPQTTVSGIPVRRSSAVRAPLLTVPLGEIPHIQGLPL